MEENKFKHPILIGCDPEIFILDAKTKKPYPIVGMIGGTKEKPLPVSDKGHFIQEDNVMAEFNVPAAKEPKDLVRDISFCIQEIDNKIGNDYIIDISASHQFDEKHLKSEQAAMFGCDPDYNVWERDMNSPPNPNGTLRTAGGHIHIGYMNAEMEISEEIVKAMDIFLGLPSIILDKDVERRKMYGNAGAFRFKDYGVEYRVLSNFWIATEEFITWAFNNAIKATESVLDGNFEILEGDGGPFNEGDDDSFDIQFAINNSDEKLAKKLIEKYKVPMP